MTALWVPTAQRQSTTERICMSVGRMCNKGVAQAAEIGGLAFTERVWEVNEERACENPFSQQERGFYLS